MRRMTRAPLTCAACAACAVLAACGSSAVKSEYPDASRGAGDARADVTRPRETGVLGGGGSEGGACESVRRKAPQVPVDLVLGVDTSFSMDFLGKWTHLSAALDAFVTDPASTGLDLGIQFFPLPATCAVSAYEELAVPVGPQASVAPQIVQAIAGKRMAGGTPTVQVLEGLVAYLRAHTVPGFKPVIVLATDGVPDATCLYAPDGGTPNSLANAEAVAKAAFEGSPSIPTFVIGVGSELGPLDGLAAAGGTGAATLVDVAGDAGDPKQAFVAALDTIRAQSLPCEFSLPTGVTIEPTLTNVTLTPASGAAQTFLYVASAAGCPMAATSGWYFDDAATPTEVILCPAACEAVQADPGAEVDVDLGCPRDGLK